MERDSLAALSPRTGDVGRVSHSTAEEMPEWLMSLTQWMDDYGSTEERPSIARRYASLASRWSALDEAAWRRLDLAARRIALAETIQHEAFPPCLTHCSRLIAWLDAGAPESAPERALVDDDYYHPHQARWAMARARVAVLKLASLEIFEAERAGGRLAADHRDVCMDRAADRLTTAFLDALEAECRAAESDR